MTVDDGSVEVVVAGGVNAEASTEIFRGGIWLPGEQLVQYRLYSLLLSLRVIPAPDVLLKINFAVSFEGNTWKLKLGGSLGGRRENGHHQSFF